MTIWLVEGLPGTGKSTMAEHLCTLARESGNDAIWYLEESTDHPVHSRSVTAQRRHGGNFIEACLHSWSRFADKCEMEDVIHILEGSAFQSTVRFMMEEKLAGIEDYYRHFEEIVAPLNPRMVYLRPRDPFQHSHYVSELRGKDWSGKVSGYLETTSYSIDEGLSGLRGMHRFWTDYAALCDQLVARSRVPIKIIEVVPGDWTRHMAEAVGFLELKRYGAPENALRFNTVFDTGTPACGSI